MKNIDDLKKIQPLFEGWNVGDRVIFDSCSIEQQRWGSNDNPNGLLVSNQEYIISSVEVRSCHTKLSLMNIKGKFNSVCFFHYPYPHQIWEKVDWEKISLSTYSNGSISLTEDLESCFRTQFFDDPETALLKALVWQIEQENKDVT